MRATVSPIAPLLVLALLAAGCLFIEEVNHPPVATIRIKSGAAQPADPEKPVPLPKKCDPLELDAAASNDPDEGREDLKFQWKVLHQRDDGMLVEPAMGEVELFAEREMANLRIRAAGVWQVELIVFDKRGAQSKPARLTFDVADAPPRAQIEPELSPSGCGDYGAGARIGLAAIGEMVDADEYCDADRIETLTWAWRATAPMGSAKSSLEPGPCGQQSTPAMLTVAADEKMPERTRRVCLWTDGPGTYEIELTADDGAGRPPAELSKNGQMTRLTVTVAGDRPPCMDGFLPAPARLYYLDRDQPAIFEVVEVLDDLDPFPGGGASFRWSLWHESDPVWRPVTGFRQAGISIDPTTYAVDELVRVRVEVEDRVARDTSACDPMKLVCDYATAYSGAQNCFQGATCEAWVTWEARFR